VLAAEFDGSGSRTRRYTYDGGWAPAELVVNGTSETAYAVTTDHLDTPWMLTNGSGVAVWRSSHESFGAAVVDEDPDGDSNVVSFHVRFPGQYADAETGLHYNLSRVYQSGSGRYLSSDPIGQVGGTNLFVYAALNPVRFIDPNGLQASPGDDSITARAKAIAAKGDTAALKRFMQQFSDDFPPDKAAKLLKECEINRVVPPAFPGTPTPTVGTPSPYPTPPVTNPQPTTLFQKVVFEVAQIAKVAKGAVDKVNPH
jgi:RHS repeat-associated protein